MLYNTYIGNMSTCIGHTVYTVDPWLSQHLLSEHFDYTNVKWLLNYVFYHHNENVYVL